MSSTSNSYALLNEWSPEYIVASCAGKDSEYGFPHKEAVLRCLDVTNNVYATFKSGDILFTINGEEYTINCKDEEKLGVTDAF